jgi:hypothetical protein
MSNDTDPTAWIDDIDPPPQRHAFTVLPDPEEDGLYVWACLCGAGDDGGETFASARKAGAHHVAVQAARDVRCASLAPGKHWSSLVMGEAFAVATGDRAEPFPDHMTREDIDRCYKQAYAMLVDIEPGLDKMCPECLEWERESGLRDEYAAERQ